MVSHQQLRWVRTTLLGRTPGWSPPAAPVGPWRPVWLERRRALEVGDLRLTPALDGRRGVLALSGNIVLLGGGSLDSASFLVVRHGRRYSAPLNIAPGAEVIRGKVEVPDVETWWPHTHGEPALYEVRLEFTVTASDGTQSEVVLDLGRVGFRTVTLDRSGGDFALSVNGVKTFCRGATWTPLDCVSLNATAADYVDAVEQVRAAGMNMLRVAGPFVYETDAFLDLCDASGILLWQDFMFANMDYPAEDPDFAANVNRETAQQLTRLQAHPSLAGTVRQQRVRSTGGDVRCAARTVGTRAIRDDACSPRPRVLSGCPLLPIQYAWWGLSVFRRGRRHFVLRCWRLSAAARGCAPLGTQIRIRMSCVCQRTGA